MGEIDRFRGQLLKLLSGALDVAQVEELKCLLRSIAASDFVGELPTKVASDPKRGYGRVQLFREARAELALVVLQPGQRIRPHDHGDYGAHTEVEPVVGLVHVFRGQELNRFYTLNDGASLEETGCRVIRAGEFLELSPTIIHSVENPGEVTAASLHAYIYAQEDPATKKRRF